MAVGATRRAALYLPDPLFSRWEATLQEMASSSLVLWGGDGPGQLGHRPRPRSAAGPRGCTEPVRARGLPLDRGRVERHSGPASPVRRWLGARFGVALPAFREPGAGADQVDSLRRLVRGPDVPDHRIQRAHLRTVVPGRNR